MKITKVDVYLDNYKIITGKYWIQKNKTIKKVQYNTVISIDADDDNKPIKFSEKEIIKLKFVLGAKERILNCRFHIICNLLKSYLLVSSEDWK
jgi:hypothetical protein